MSNDSESAVGKWFRIILGLAAIGLGVSSVITGVAYPLSTSIVSNEPEYHGLFARLYGAFFIFCGLCAVFNWTQFGDSGDL